MVLKLNLEGDEQADLKVHGGENKAVYAYPSEHYEFWKQRFSRMDFSWGQFAENLTTEGLLEETVHVGDQLFIGTTVFEVTRPRFPCYKLASRFGTLDMIDWFLNSERTGFYLKVLKEGMIEAGDFIKQITVKANSETITSMVRRERKVKNKISTAA
jgi:MOSC domain-containing protein YiiM